MEHKIYTISDLREWLIHNTQNGLSTYCIAPARAWAIIHNPCAEDTDPALVVTFHEGKPIGYSAVFADEYIKGNTKGRFSWGSTEWIEPEFRGKGIAGKMMRTLKEAVGVERYIGLDSSIASVKLDQKQGAGIVYYDRMQYQLRSKSSLKGWILSKYITSYNRAQLKRLEKYDYKNEYVYFVDEQTYQFIAQHAQQDLFLRRREMLNWMLRYPFLIGTHNDPKIKADICEFGSTVSEYTIEAVKVYVHEELVGFYIISQTDKVRTLRYLYYDESYREEVLASVTLNLLKQDVDKFYFMHSELQEFMNKHSIKRLNRKTYIDQIALTLPPNMKVKENLHVQGGDGDMFC